MKKVITTILSFVAAFAMVLATGEADDPRMQVPWTLGCMAVVYIIYKIMDKMGALKDERDLENEEE